MKISQTMLTFDTPAKVSEAQDKLDAAYDTYPVIYTRMGLQLTSQPQVPAIDDRSPRLSLLQSTTSATGESTT